MSVVPHSIDIVVANMAATLGLFSEIMFAELDAQ